jgi:hypothetical protein
MTKYSSFIDTLIAPFSNATNNKNKNKNSLNSFIYVSSATVGDHNHCAQIKASFLCEIKWYLCKWRSSLKRKYRRREVNSSLQLALYIYDLLIEFEGKMTLGYILLQQDSIYLQHPFLAKH